MRRLVPCLPWLTPTLVLLIASTGSLCFGHGDMPPAPPTPPVTNPPQPGYIVREKVYPPRWSWIHWWEANRDPYLKMLTQRSSTQRTDQAQVKALRDKAVKALTAAMSAPAPEARAAAILALGRMNERPAFAAISNLAQADPDEKVRRAALVAMGLLDSPDTRDFLLACKYPTDLLFEAGSGGLGLLHRADDNKVLATLQQSVTGGKSGVATISAWGLKQRADPANVKFLAAVLQGSKSPWLASEALLALGRQNDPNAIPLLADVLMATKAASNLAAWEALETHDHDVQGLGGDKASIRVDELEKINKQYKKFGEWRDQGPNGGIGNPGTVVIKVGIEKVYITELRASAAISLGDIQDPKSQKVLLATLALPDDKFSDLYKGFAIMSLGRIGNEEILPPLLDYVAPKHRDGKKKSLAEMDSPLRGFAALALGLYARAKGGSLAGNDAPQYDKVCEVLADRVADREDTLELRAACTLALGLTGRTECLKLLNRARVGIGASEDLLAGYTMLASAMIGDRNIVEAAKRFLGTTPRDEDGPTALLGRRAAVLALGLTENPDALPVLADAWNLSYHVNREVPVALALRGAYDAVDPLVKLLTTTANPLEQAFASRCLGELFNEERPHRLAWFLNDCNYTLRNMRMAPYQTMANEFLYVYLIPCFGDQWQ